VLRCPGGNGGLLAALADAGILSTLDTWGIRDLFAFQYPNALEQVCDPVLLGYHRRGGHDVTLKVADGARPGEQVGRMACWDGRPVVVEYHFLPPGAAGDGLPFYIGTGVWSVEFPRRCWERDEQPPYRVVAHAEPGFAVPLRKVEQLLHDLLRYADSVGVALGDREVEYATVKRPSGPDSVVAAQAALTRRYRAWLDHVGACPEGPITRLEIDPEFALCAEDLATALPEGFCYSDGLVLE
jgi:UDP-N-acetylglucosamine/UDP-N-acetylgalactosamine diphosphorylase